jgi:serine/threonine protein phosphatase 1
MTDDHSQIIDFAHASAPDGMMLFAIGDIHGCRDQLARMHKEIQAQIDRRKPADWRIIHLGDYVDRGPDSKGVLEFLVEAQARDERNVMLGGNHDVGFLEFLHEPTPNCLFIRFGGIETAASYGVDLEFDSPDTLRACQQALIAAMPKSHVEFLLSLNFSVTIGDFFFCHAGIKPHVPLTKQDPEILIWIRDEFLDHQPLHPKLIVHGHTPVSAPQVLPNRVNVDTGCFRTGVLTALVVDGKEKSFLTVRADD